LTLKELNQEFIKLQNKYGAKELDAIYNGSCTNNPNFCFVFMYSRFNINKTIEDSKWIIEKEIVMNIVDPINSNKKGK